jgi:hypothetical protein
VITLAFVLTLFALGLTLIDFLQTISIASDPFGDFNHRTVFGANPAPSKICRYYAGLAGCEILCAILLFALSKELILCVGAAAIIILEAAFVRVNYVKGTSARSK